MQLEEIIMYGLDGSLQDSAGPAQMVITNIT